MESIDRLIELNSRDSNRSCRLLTDNEKWLAKSQNGEPFMIQVEATSHQ